MGIGLRSLGRLASSPRRAGSALPKVRRAASLSGLGGDASSYQKRYEDANQPSERAQKIKKYTQVVIAGWIVFTALAAGAAEKTKDESFVFTAVGDFGARLSTSAVLDGIAGSGSEFHLAVGDMSYNEMKPESAWCKYVQSHLPVDFPFEVVSGNHEENGPHGDIRNFAKGLPDRLKSSGKYGKEYFFDYPQKSPLARFILVSPNLNFKWGGKYDYKKGDKHYAWLSKAIDQARAKGIRWVVVGMHKNCISTGNKKCEIGEDVFNLLIEKKVDLILQGHDHNYQRSKALSLSDVCLGIRPGFYNAACVADAGTEGTFRKGAGSILVIAGTGGESIYPVNPADPEAPYFAKIIGDPADRAYGFARFTVSSDQIIGEFVPTRKDGATNPNLKDQFRIVDTR